MLDVEVRLWVLFVVLCLGFVFERFRLSAEYWTYTQNAISRIKHLAPI